MFQKKLIIILFTAVLLYSCANTPGDQSFDSPVGTWRIQIETQYSPLSATMTFSDDGKVNYTFRNGRIFFDDVDGLGNWKGHWVEDGMATVTCDGLKDGSKTWGEVEFQFNETHTKFQGTYNLCGEGFRESWTGRRI